MTALVPRLAKVLGMMDSSFDGEVVAAGRMATRIVKAAGMTWEDVLAAPGLASQHREAKSPPRGWRADLATCRSRHDLLSSWEAAFVASLRSYSHAPSDRQRAVLADIAGRVARTRRHERS